MTRVLILGARRRHGREGVGGGDGEIDYGITLKGEPFQAAGESVSRKSVADLVVKLATTPGLEVRRSLGVHKAT